MVVAALFSGTLLLEFPEYVAVAVCSVPRDARKRNSVIVKSKESIADCLKFCRSSEDCKQARNYTLSR